MASPTETRRRPTYSLVTREDQMERLSKSSYARAQSGRFSPVSESGSYGHSQRPTSPQRPLRHDSYAGPSRHLLTPPIPGRLADTQEEKDEAIANYIRSHIENHLGWMEYMQSKARPQRVSEVLKQYTFVEDRIRELIERKTPPHWDGAPNCYVEKVKRIISTPQIWLTMYHSITSGACSSWTASGVKNVKRRRSSSRFTVKMVRDTKTRVSSI